VTERRAEYVGVPVDADVLAQVLERHEDYRVLRRIRRMDLQSPRLKPEGSIVGIAVGVQTTGLDPGRHEIIELAVQPFRLDAEHRIIETGRPRNWLEQPSESIPPEITRVTGLTDADVAGRAIPDGEAACMILGADFVVSHNAEFDRPFLEKRLPHASGKPWACSLADVDWRGRGFADRTLSALLGRMGWFYDAHRAEVDVAALLQLLAHPFPDGPTVAGVMLERAIRPTWVVDVVDAPFSAKDVLKDRGYRWDGARRLWSVQVVDEAVRDEVGWATLMLYGGRREPKVRRVTWKERYAASP
jgi:DNA polymerase-3 subunit epsilon